MNIVTASQKASPAIQEKAKATASSLGFFYVERKKQSLKSMQEKYGAEYILVYGSQGPSVYFGPKEEHSFHLSMAQLRILRLQKGEQDHLVEAVKVLMANHESSYKLLDATLGLASDSIVLSYGLGPQWHITGLEGSLPLWFVSSEGLAQFEHENPDVTAALRRIEAIHARNQDYLKACPDQSYDVVYFDPMFEVPVEASPQFAPLRGHLVEEAFTEESLREALRVSRYGVIVKERPFSSIFTKMPPDEMVGGKYSRITYGVYRKLSHE